MLKLFKLTGFGGCVALLLLLVMYYCFPEGRWFFTPGRTYGLFGASSVLILFGIGATIVDKKRDIHA